MTGPSAQASVALAPDIQAIERSGHGIEAGHEHTDIQIVEIVGRPEQQRRIATRYDKIALPSQSCPNLTSLRLCLKPSEKTL